MNSHEIETLENNITEGTKEVRKNAYYIFEDMFNEGASENQLYWSQEATWESFKKLYNSICIYFEASNLQSYLIEFKIRYSRIVNEKVKCLEFVNFPISHGEDWEEDFKLLLEWYELLHPFSFFKNDKPKLYCRLINYLTETNDLLKLTKTSVQNESDINQLMRRHPLFGMLGFAHPVL
jgi:hypothetical protein